MPSWSDDSGPADLPVGEEVSPPRLDPLAFCSSSVLAAVFRVILPPTRSFRIGLRMRKKQEPAKRVRSGATTEKKPLSRLLGRARTPAGSSLVAELRLVT
jgi:hypothetical protein